ncbi:DUF2207 family protein [Clostridium oryzae]|uniref:Predicted membrane protein YciQ-like C-terminal domain-containing protein n=1 Tax=Clostridium oryzae TaxID=1450648 RepID=A0A1V4IQ26_9CLOT|nr:DUF2207 domain-containing protein [Clostridium oryzae]OPJ62141.1 hypothetical protein CLORY_19640 [Clostridium oryzae]
MYLTLPQEINRKQVKYTGEGPKRGLASIDEKKRIKLELNDMGNDEVIGAQVSFPPDWVNASKTINMTKSDYDEMVKKQRMEGIAAVAATILGVTAITSGAIYVSGKKRRKAIGEYRSQYMFYSDKYYSQLPSDLPPELVAQLLNRSIDINELMASILNLENKGAISFLESGFFDRDYNNLCFVINPDSPHHKLLRSESYLVEWLREYADQNVVYLSFIKRNASKAHFSNKFTVWKGIVKSEAERLDFYTSVMGKKILTNEYEDERIKWNAFKAYLRDSGQQEVMQLKEKGLWDKILPYAMVLDVASGVIKHIEQYSDDSRFNDSSSIFMNYWFLNYYTGMYYGDIHRGYTTYTNHVNSSSSGNFSGGGGGGFGGGGGSSAF